MINRRAVISCAAAVALPRAMRDATAQSSLSEMEALARKARAEGQLASLGMPADWANWGATWSDLSRLYGLKHVDTDMSSAEEIAKMAAEGRNGTADIGDVGFEFGEVARKRGITAAFKPSTWMEIPNWAKDVEGHWMLSYTGTIALCTRRNLAVANANRGSVSSWREALSGRYRVCIGEVGRAAQANAAVLAAAISMGGHESDLRNALDAFARLQAQGRLLTVNPSVNLMERQEADVYLMWDFNALNYAAKVGEGSYRVHIPEDGSVTSGYTTIINRYAPHPAAARLAREYILSNAGQLNLARGRARPIRVDRIDLPREVSALLLPATQYQVARPVDVEPWTAAARALAAGWQAAINGARR